MDKNRIHRTASNLDLQSLIRRCDIAYDERARYVEFVCDVWNEGRFGVGRADPVIINKNNDPKGEPALFSDQLDDEPSGPVANFEILSLGRAASQLAEPAFRRANQTGLLDAGLNAHNSILALMPNQGRGSPLTLTTGRASFLLSPTVRRNPACGTAAGQ